jgi:hypothetical protein
MVWQAVLAAALLRAEGNVSHDMCVRQHKIVDERVLDFLKRTRPAARERAVA